MLLEWAHTPVDAAAYVVRLLGLDTEEELVESAVIKGEVEEVHVQQLVLVHLAADFRARVLAGADRVAGAAPGGSAPHVLALVVEARDAAETERVGGGRMGTVRNR